MDIKLYEIVNFEYSIKEIRLAGLFGKAGRQQFCLAKPDNIGALSLK